VYDCVILTQTLPFIFDVQAALRTVERILKPGGVLLLTVPGISPISRYDAERWGDYWRFTPQAVQRLVSERFGTARVEVHIYGNVRAAGALLEGRAVHELRPIELEHTDADYPVIIAARAVKRGLESARAKDAGACGQGASEGAPDAALPSAWDAVADRLDDYPIVSERFRYAVGIRPLLALPADARILEAGCGSGRVLRTLAALGYRRLVGLEISPQRLEQVRRRGPSGVELVCNQGFPFAPASFDAVVSTGVIEHVPNPRGWLARLARVVRPGGIVSLTSDTYMWRWLQKLGLYRSIQPLDRAIWPGTLIRWARAAGLCLTACGGFYNTPEQRRFFLKQLTRLAPGGQRLRWYLHRDEEAVDDTGDETSAIRAALDDWSARVRFGRWWCIGSYESFYWLRRAESAP
jgi:SAM-dependent methyltransferase